MKDGDAPSGDKSTEGSVQGLASHALSILLQGRQKPKHNLCDNSVSLLADMVLAKDRFDVSDCIDRLCLKGLTPEDLIDAYVPEAARLLGRNWCEDNTSFADVTVGSARLQLILRRVMDTADLKEPSEPTGGASVIMVIPACNTHTLGPLVCASQMRRQGHIVKVALGETSAKVASLINEHKFDVMLVSVGSDTNILPTKDLIRSVRRQVHRKLPIVAGGPILHMHDDLAFAVGADDTLAHPLEIARLVQRPTSRAARHPIGSPSVERV
jgi:methanogenic corrinoid protein MtbC1